MSQRNTRAKPKGVDSADGGDKGISKQAHLLGDDVGHFSMVRALHLADLITTLNGFCGLMSIFSSMRYCLSLPISPLSTPITSTNTTALWTALAFMPLGLFFDFFDGKVARWRNKSSLMGQELDSLADLISFGAAPAACAFAIGMRTAVDHILLGFFVICGLLRLARFNVTVASLPKDKSGKSKYFEGTPIPTSLSIAALMAWWVSRGWVQGELPFGVLGEGNLWEVHVATGLFVVHGCAMISKSLRIPKP